ncbi:MAG: hypothetical protein Unbinned706contig1001_4 [Prokaryotic dsDNA virus sp.]|nr:MAG: hypothetical protein Unbinned706contig1001_4 [Prokaryotic dsDNA virus sp.]|tara:strand:- start:7957 stop:8316 length:360 start_codon:yes stop_codon:yes gene_type:complete
MEEELIHIITLRSKLRYNFATRSKTNDITKREIRQIERDLTRVLQKQIEKQGHVDTGLMVRTIKVEIRPSSRGKMITNILGVDYWKYVNGNYDIFNNAQRTRAWKKIEGDFNFLNRGVR